MAIVVLEDSFNDLTKVDTTRTNAFVDTVNGCVRLPKVTTPNAAAMNKFGDFAIATLEGIKFFAVDDAGGTILDPSRTVELVTDAIHLSLPAEAPSLWAYRPGELIRYEFDDAAGSFSEDPMKKVLGLSDVMSISCFPQDDGIAILNKSANNTGIIDVQVNTDDGGIALAFSWDTGLPDPVAVSVVPFGTTPDLLYQTTNSTYYFAYDEATGTYINDLTRQVEGTNNVSLSATKHGFGALSQMEGKQYAFTDDNPMEVTALSTGPLTGAVALSMNPDGYSQVIVTETGEVQYWFYDEETDSMVRDHSMEQTGLRLQNGYVSPKEYYSKPVAGETNYDEVRLTVTHDIPEDTSINYFVSSDGGNTFNPVTPGLWVAIPEGENFVVKATLATNNKEITPKIFFVKLEATKLVLSDLRVLHIAKNELGQVVPTDVFPVKVKVGAMINFEIKTNGCAESVVANFTIGGSSTLVPITPLSPEVPEQNIWRGTYIVPSEAVEGTTIGITFSAARSTKNSGYVQNPFVLVWGNVLNTVDLILTN